MSLKKSADDALFKLVKDKLGTNSAESIEKMRRHFAEGLDADTLAKYTKHLRKLAKDNAETNELLALSMALDYVPMISGSVAIRYSCRHEGCGVIPKRETDWFHAKQPGHAKKVHWLCPACSGEFAFNTAATSGGATDSKGQDKPYQHVLFLQLPWSAKGELRTFCAKA